jgi:hypothetical protein
MKKLLRIAAPLLFLFQGVALGRGVSPYLPLNLDPELERQIARVLVLADKPMLTRPIAAAAVLDALPAACGIEPALCLEVRQALSRYMHSSGLSHASLEAATGEDAAKTIPNRYGLSTDSAWQASASAYWQPSDYALLTLAGVADDEEISPAGSMISLGWSRLQFDIGYRPHWLSPMTDSSMLLSTHSPAMPSITLSNYTALTRFGISYQAFITQMSRSDSIAFGSTFTSGRPKLAGLHLSVEPASGWALGVSRLMQYGGGDRGGNSFSDLLKAFFRPSQYDNTNPSLEADEQFGNQLAAITSEFVFPGRVPFSVYFEYAGEDTSRGRDYLLGNSALAAGIRFPRLLRQFDLTFETSEWQNSWYVNSVYGDGLRNDGHVVGHWAGDERVFGDAVGGRSHMLRLGWSPRFGGSGEITVRSLENEDYSGAGYKSAYDVGVRYSQPFGHLRIGAEAFTGQDVFGSDYSWFGAFVRYVERSTDRDPVGVGLGADQVDLLTHLFVEAGVNASEVKIDLDDAIPRTATGTDLAPHFAIGARRAVSDRSDLGARLELDEVDGRWLVGVRAIDYRYRFSRPLTFSFFIGAARYDVETPAYGIYYGIGGQWRDLLPGWDVGVDLKYATKIARDHVLPTDPQGVRDDSFYDISAATLSVSRRF